MNLQEVQLQAPLAAVTVMVPQEPQAPLLQGKSLGLLMGRVMLVWPLQGSPRSGYRPLHGHLPAPGLPKQPEGS